MSDRNCRTSANMVTSFLFDKSVTKNDKKIILFLHLGQEKKQTIADRVKQKTDIHRRRKIEKIESVVFVAFVVTKFTFLRQEEKILRARYGDAYVQYEEKHPF